MAGDLAEKDDAFLGADLVATKDRVECQRRFRRVDPLPQARLEMRIIAETSYISPP